MPRTKTARPIFKVKMTPTSSVIILFRHIFSYRDFLAKPYSRGEEPSSVPALQRWHPGIDQLVLREDGRTLKKLCLSMENLSKKYKFLAGRNKFVNTTVLSKSCATN